MSAVTHCRGHDRGSARFEFPIDIMTPIDYCVIRSCHRRHPGMRISRNYGHPREHRNGVRGPHFRSKSHNPEVGCIIRRMLDSDSDACWTPIPMHAGQRFRPMVDTEWPLA